uniref:ArsC/Spx/MgsR family protein n=1 Tax=Roseihalotalea indica TaxID=2867963 RepID=A0AA49GS39_9BACT|nr:ArsC/Spx/MgsR family protein [Tunicatimonas sp. TK19036]
MEWNPKEVVIIYNFEERGNREAVAYAKQIAQHVNEIDISKNPLTERQLAELLDRLGVGIEDIIDRRSDLYKEKYQDVDMEEADWLGVIKHNPELMRTPIGILGDKAVICESPGDMLKLDDGQGFDQNMKT